MEKIIERLKNGYRFCLKNVSPECLKFDKKEYFTGHYCEPCFKHKTKEYYAGYMRKYKKEREQAIGDMQLTRKERKGLEDYLDELGDDGDDHNHIVDDDDYVSDTISD